MFDFFRTHPDPEVRDDLPGLIRSLQVRTNWSPNGVSAAFVRHLDRKTGQVHSVISMDPKLVRGQDARSQLVIYHEYQHYLQWRDKTIPEETFLDVPWPDKDLTGICEQKMVRRA